MALASNSAVGQRLAFGEFELAPAARGLWRADVPIKIGARALDILIALASRPGEVLSKDDLNQIVWGGAYIDETAVRVGVSAARRALGEGGQGYITTVPGRGYCFVQDVVSKGSPLSRQGPAPLRPQRLPRQIVRIVGRDAEMETLCGELDRHRLVSVVGPGGIGKTTVALAAASRLREAFDAVAFVDLAPVQDAGQMSAGAAAALGLSVGPRQDPVEEIGRAVEGRRVLVVFDNCEHLVDEVAALVETLLGRAPGATVLATTREVLRAAGEWVHQLAPLEAPPVSNTISAQDARCYPAVELFEERAAFALGGYELDDTDAPYVADICRRLDGIALAIELGVGRLPGLGIQGLASSLEDSFRVLTHGRRTALPRHQTLRAMFEWSYGLLSTEERDALRRLSVFVGPFTLEDAGAVIGRDESVADADRWLTSLLDKSLVGAGAHSEPTRRYSLLETTRTFAQDKLSEAGEARFYRRRHAERTRADFERARAEWDKLAVADWLQSYSGQLGNLRSALDWAFSPEGDGALGAALTAAAAPLWFHLSLLDEGLARVARAIAWLKAQPAPDRDLIERLYAVSVWPQVQPINGAANTPAAWRDTLARAVQAGDISYQLQAVRALWVNCFSRGAAAEALVLAECFAALAQQSSNPQDALVARRMHGRSLHFVGDFAGSQRETEQMLALYGAQPSDLVRLQYDQRLTAQVVVARNLWLQGRADQALVLVDRLVEEAEALGHNATLSFVLFEAACFVALWAGDLTRAARFTSMHRKLHALDEWRFYSDAFEGEILIRRGRAGEGAKLMSDAIKSLMAGGFHLYVAAFEGVLAEGLLARGQLADATEAADRAVGRCRASGEAWCLAELMRVRALVLAAADRPAEAVDVLRDALEVARAQGALAWERRLATTLTEVRRAG